MFAVLKTGGKQYKVAKGDVLRVERLAAFVGDAVQFNEVLMVGDRIGAPLVEDAGVQAEVIDQIKGEKVIHFVKRRRKHGSKRTKGHRQRLTILRVTDIVESGASESGVKAAVSARSDPHYRAILDSPQSEILDLVDRAAKLIGETLVQTAPEDDHGHPSEENEVLQVAGEPRSEAGITEDFPDAADESEVESQDVEDVATAGPDIVERPIQAAEGRGEVEDSDEQAK